MVVKHPWPARYECELFESSVISYGSQTVIMSDRRIMRFESSVISYGSGARLNNGQSFWNDPDVV